MYQRLSMIFLIALLFIAGFVCLWINSTNLQRTSDQMFGKYLDVNINSLIGDLPTVINHNNEVSRKEFDNIFDSSSNWLKKSLVANDGRVKTHWGEFINLKCEDLVVNNSVSGKGIEDLIDSKLGSSMSHKNLKHRFSWDPNNSPADSSLITFAHDTKMIVTDFSSVEKNIGEYAFTNRDTVSLREELDTIEEVINLLLRNISLKESDDTLATDENPMTDQAYESQGKTLEEQISEILQKLTNIENRVAFLERNS